MNTKHTKGNWQANLQPEMNFRIGAYIPGEGCVGLVATVEDNNQIDFDQSEANAKLISAAPDMLNALSYLIEESKKWFTPLGKTDPVYPMDITQAIHYGNEAIKKATT